jgi:hypothetical protein
MMKTEKKSWYQKKQEEEIKKWIKKNRGDDLYDEKLMQELLNYPESVREAHGVTTARAGKIDYTTKEFTVTLSEPYGQARESMIEKMKPLQEEYNDLNFKLAQRLAAVNKQKSYEDAKDKYFLSNSREEASKHIQDHYKKYPLTPEQAWPSNWPKPGEIYECGRVDTPEEWRRKQAEQSRGIGMAGAVAGMAAKKLGKVVVGSTGGDFDADKFKDLWMNSGVAIWDSKARNYGSIHRGSYKPFSPTFTNHSLWLDFGVDHAMKFSDRVRPVYGTYPRRMLLLL